LLELSVTVVTE